MSQPKTRRSFLTIIADYLSRYASPIPSTTPEPEPTFDEKVKEISDTIKNGLAIFQSALDAVASSVETAKQELAQAQLRQEMVTKEVATVQSVLAQAENLKSKFEAFLGPLKKTP